MEKWNQRHRPYPADECSLNSNFAILGGIPSALQNDQEGDVKRKQVHQVNRRLFQLTDGRFLSFSQE
jgi:hypothetical protein